MSHPQMGNILPNKTAASMDREIAARVNVILRREYQDMSSSLKEIGRATGIASHTIKRWYEGRNAPSAGHLIILALHFPAVLKMILDLSGYEYLACHVDQPGNVSVPQDAAENNGTLNDTINSEPPNLNERQLWFLEGLRAGQALTADDICRQWSAFLRTARRDIADLKDRGLIRFEGAKKTGYYEIIKSPLG